MSHEIIIKKVFQNLQLVIGMASRPVTPIFDFEFVKLVVFNQVSKNSLSCRGDCNPCK